MRIHAVSSVNLLLLSLQQSMHVVLIMVRLAGIMQYYVTVGICTD